MRAAGRTISFDPNLRPTLWQSPETMRHWINTLATYADWVLPGMEEGVFLTGETTPEGVARFYRERGAKLVVVKLGPEGAYYDSDVAGTGRVPGVPVAQVVDTVGAGDGFAVGVISALLEGLPVPAAVRRARGWRACGAGRYRGPADAGAAGGPVNLQHSGWALPCAQEGAGFRELPPDQLARLTAVHYVTVAARASLMNVRHSMQRWHTGSHRLQLHRRRAAKALAAGGVQHLSGRDNYALDVRARHHAVPHPECLTKRWRPRCLPSSAPSRRLVELCSWCARAGGPEHWKTCLAACMADAGPAGLGRIARLARRAALGSACR
jgi:hypothetical protein